MFIYIYIYAYREGHRSNLCIRGSSGTLELDMAGSAADLFDTLTQVHGMDREWLELKVHALQNSDVGMKCTTTSDGLSLAPLGMPICMLPDYGPTGKKSYRVSIFSTEVHFRTCKYWITKFDSSLSHLKISPTVGWQKNGGPAEAALKAAMLAEYLGDGS